MIKSIGWYSKTDYMIKIVRYHNCDKNTNANRRSQNHAVNFDLRTACMKFSLPVPLVRSFGRRYKVFDRLHKVLTACIKFLTACIKFLTTCIKFLTACMKLQTLAWSYERLHQGFRILTLISHHNVDVCFLSIAQYKGKLTIVVCCTVSSVKFAIFFLNRLTNWMMLWFFI